MIYLFAPSNEPRVRIKLWKWLKCIKHSSVSAISSNFDYDHHLKMEGGSETFITTFLYGGKIQSL